MPTYDYRCGKCGKKFSAVLTISEHDRKKPKCRKCGSRKITQQFSAFFAVTSNKS